MTAESIALIPGFPVMSCSLNCDTNTDSLRSLSAMSP